MKKILIILGVAMISANMWAENSRLSLGLRGGGSLYNTSDNLENKIGPAGMLDLGYTCLWPVSDITQIGFRVGLGAGYSESKLCATIHQQYSTTDYLGQEIDYTITSPSLVETTQQIILEMPLQLAFHFEGFYCNLGAKLMTPIAWSQYKQDIEDLTIRAYYMECGVAVTNRLITGKAGDEQLHQTRKAPLPLLSVAMAADLGYEWTINDKHHIGLGFFLDVNVWEYADKNTSPSTDIVTISQIGNPANPVPTVEIAPLRQTLTTTARYFDFGIKFYYAFSVGKRPAEEHNEL